MDWSCCVQYQRNLEAAVIAKPVRQFTAAPAGLAFALVVSGFLFPGPAHACTLCSCSATTSDVNFGAYDPNGPAPTDTSGTITVNCTGVLALFGSVEAAASPGSSGNTAQRTMRQGGDSLAYNLYVDSARTVVFGDGNSGTATLVAPLNGLLIFNQSLPFYARLPARQWTRAGTYSDNIVITITY